MTGFYEKWEYYGKQEHEKRFVSLHYNPNRKEQLINGEMPKTHGYSYLLTRIQLEELGEEMGLGRMVK